MKNFLDSLLTGRRDLLLVCAMVTILVILFTPIPPGLLDFLLVVNFSVALLVLLLTFHTEKPLSFSTFPSLLLMTTLFRVALNVSATRLILDGANAGRVIGAVGAYVVGGNYVVGLVVFLILVVVQYVVVTSGAQRVAEVAARFTLDSMPGKQMSIDADMNMGIIDDKEAKRRRSQIEKEANFYGAMDGATKFVKGDAIAGIIILLIDIIGGLSVGVVQRGLSWSDALHTYTLLTVGDGIVTQIPSLVVATATGIIITRAATDAQLGEEISRQVFAHPRTLLIVVLALLGVLFMPGVPLFPVLVVLGLFGSAAYFAIRSRAKEALKTAVQDIQENSAEAPEDIYETMRIEPLEIRIGKGLTSHLVAQSATLTERLQGLRRQFALDYGFVLPQVRVSPDPKLASNQYAVHVYGSRSAFGELAPDKMLAINPGGKRPQLEGEQTTEPTYGLPALWISQEQRQFARGAGYTLVDPETVLLTHFSETLRRQAPDMLTRAETERLVNRIRDDNASLLDELIPNVLTYSDIQKVLQQLLSEKVSIRNIEAILEVLVDNGKKTKVPEELTEKVRERLGPGICQTVADSQGEVHVLTLAPDLERLFMQAVRQKDGAASLFTNPGQFDQFHTNLVKQCEAMMAKSLLPVLLCPAAIRRHIRLLIQRSMPHITILGINELPPSAKVRAFAMVGLDANTPQQRVAT